MPSDAPINVGYYYIIQGLKTSQKLSYERRAGILLVSTLSSMTGEETEARSWEDLPKCSDFSQTLCQVRWSALQPFPLSW